MKQFVVIVLMAVLVMTGCASTGGSSGGDAPQVDLNANWFLAREEGGMRARNNQVTLRKGENYLYVYFRNGAPGADFDKVQLHFNVTNPIDFKWQAAYHPGAVFGTNEENLIKGITDGPLESDLSDLKEAWFNISDFSSLEKAEMNGLVIRVDDAEGRSVFTLTDVVFIGLKN